MKTIKTWFSAVALFAAALFFLSPAYAAPQFPKLTGRVVDDAHILSDGARAQLTQKLETLEQTTTRQLVVVTLPDLQGYDSAEFGYQLARAWGIGQKKENNGVLFIIAPKERAMRIEVGYGLEPILTDALSSLILSQKVTPRFRNGDMEGGIVAGTDALIEQLSLDEAAAIARVQQAKETRQQTNEIIPLFVIVMIFIVLSILGRVFGGRGKTLWWLPLLFMGGGGGGRGGRGGWGGGGFGGGGFGGGGGSFGGGGASGRW